MQKVPHLEGLSSNYSKLFRVVYKGLLAHAEVLKNVLKGFIGCDGATCDVAKMGEGDTKVLSKEVTTKLEVKTFSKRHEAYQPFAMAAILLLLLEVLLRITVLRRIP